MTAFEGGATMEQGYKYFSNDINELSYWLFSDDQKAIIERTRNNIPVLIFLNLQDEERGIIVNSILEILNSPTVITNEGYPLGFFESYLDIATYSKDMRFVPHIKQYYKQLTSCQRKSKVNINLSHTRKYCLDILYELEHRKVYLAKKAFMRRF